jgi:sugar lactone lactonase YvrE
MHDQQLLRLDAGKLAEVADLSEWCDGPTNDMVLDAKGRAYIGNFGDLSELGRTSLVRVDADGTVSKTGSDVFFPNGSCIMPDGKTFLLAETFRGRISAFDIGADGALSNRRDWARFADPLETTDMVEAANTLPILPDGMCLDADGCIWAACAKSHGVYRVREGGEILEKIETSEQTVFATMLGGEDGKTLYLCCAAPILTVDHAASHEATLRACTVDVPSAGLP